MSQGGYSAAARIRFGKFIIKSIFFMSFLHHSGSFLPFCQMGRHISQEEQPKNIASKVYFCLSFNLRPVMWLQF